MRNLYESIFHTPTKDEIDTLNMRYAVFTDTYRAFFIKDESPFGERKTHILIFPPKPKIVIDDKLFHGRDILSGIRPKNYYVIKTNSNELHIKLGEPNAHSISLHDTKTGYENKFQCIIVYY